MKWKIVVLLLSIVLLSLLYLFFSESALQILGKESRICSASSEAKGLAKPSQYYNKTYENLSTMKTYDTYYSDTNYIDNSLTGNPITSVTVDPDWKYVASNNEEISCDNFCRKVGLTDLDNCASFNNNIHVRCKNSIGVLTMPSCVKNNIKNKCVVSNS